ncbi:hypothetical protein AAC387_Pa10g0918 [Persea americana]
MGSLVGQSIFFLLPLSLMIVGSSLSLSHADSCKPDRCSRHDPLIRFPFRINDSRRQQKQRCGYPGFDLFCKDKHTYIHFPYLESGYVLVEKIDYEMQTLTIADHKNCLWGLLFNSPNLTAAIADQYGSTSHTLVNCSKNVNFKYYECHIPCLSDAEHDAFVFPDDYSLSYLPVSCQRIKSISVPRLYPFNLNWSSKTPPLSEDHTSFIMSRWLQSYHSFDQDLHDLMWYVPGCIVCEQSEGMECRYKDDNSNDTLCCPKPPPPPPHHKGWLAEHVIIVTCIGSFLLLTTLVITIKFFWSWNSNRKLDFENQIKVDKFLENYKYLKPARYTYADLKQMTGQFKQTLGQGGYGSVFKGMLSNGTLVAVKVLKNFDVDGEEFINEVGTMGKIHHVNVVRLLGFCADRLKRALVYEFMPNESLEKYIFPTNTNDHFLGWEKLQKIAIGIAKGIEYLHQGCDQRILHFDIKPHNILLDKNFNPKISDFGLAKLCSKGQSVVSMTHARGTMGYIAPEVFSRNFGNVSSKSDVYSYGMLLLEMVGGRKNIDVTVENRSQVYFPEWIYHRLCQGDDMGLKLETNEDSNIAKKLTIVALWCIQWYPVDRPSMRNAVQMLEGSMESLAVPPDPFPSSSSADKDTNNSCPTNLPTIPE